MTPLDYRNATWEELRARVTGLRYMVLEAWRVHGPGTTREVAEKAHIDLLTFRPRTTELVQLGLVELCQPEEFPFLFTRDDAHEGVYRALSEEKARELFARRKQEAVSAWQGELQLKS